MPTQTTTRKIPNPLYAAAGAGDLAYRELRKLPERVAELRDRVAEFGPTVTDAVSDAVSDARRGADIDRLRAVARRNANALVNGAQAAQESAVAVYRGLVRRGERIVSRNVRPASARVAVDPAAKTVRAQVGVSPQPAKSSSRSTSARSTSARSTSARTTSARTNSSRTTAAKTAKATKRAPAKRAAAAKPAAKTTTRRTAAK